MAKALNPIVRQTAGERFIAEMKRRAEEAKRTNSVVNSDMPADMRQEIERSIGRDLAGSEVLRQKLHRVDTRPQSERLAAEKWRVVMEAPAQDVPYAKELRDAEEIVAREKRALMTPAERRAALIKDLSDKKIAEAAGQVAREQRMSDPAIVAALATLQTLKDRAAFDPNWSYAEFEALERAEQQLTTPGACMKTGLELTKAAVGILTAKHKDAAAGIMAQRAALEAQLAELGASAIDYAIPGQQPTASADDAWHERLFALGDEMSAKQAAVDALKGAPAEARLAAIAEVRAVHAAIDAHRATAPASATAGEGT